MPVASYSNKQETSQGHDSAHKVHGHMEGFNMIKGIRFHQYVYVYDMGAALKRIPFYAIFWVPRIFHNIYIYTYLCVRKSVTLER